MDPVLAGEDVRLGVGVPAGEDGIPRAGLVRRGGGERSDEEQGDDGRLGGHAPNLPRQPRSRAMIPSRSSMGATGTLVADGSASSAKWHAATPEMVRAASA